MRNSPSSIVETIQPKFVGLELDTNNKTIREDIIKRLSTMFNRADRRLMKAHTDTIYKYLNVNKEQQTQPYIVRILDHDYNPQRTMTFKVQNSDTTITDNVKRDLVPTTLLVNYWQDLANSKKNPHLRKRGRPRRKRGNVEVKHQPTRNQRNLKTKKHLLKTKQENNVVHYVKESKRGVTTGTRTLRIRQTTNEIK